MNLAAKNAKSAKKTWPMVRLGDVCKVVYGTRVRRKDSEGDAYPVYGGGGETFRWNTYNREDQCVVSRFAMSEECVRFVKGKFFLNDSGLTVDSNDERLLQCFLDWFLYSEQDGIYALGKGSAQKNLDVDDFVESQIPLPPLSVQREIVARLEKELGEADALAAKFMEIAENADAEFKAELDETFKNVEGEKVRLGDVCDVLAGYPFKGNSFASTGIKICGGLIISPTEIKWNECKHWESSEGLEDYLLAANDIVMALDRPWIADGFKIGMIEESDLPCLLIQRTARLRAKRIVPKYLLYLLRYPTFKEYCTFSGTTVPHISHKDIERFIIPCPPIPAQRAIVAKLDAAKDRCEKLKAAAERGLRAAEDLRKAILAEAFEQ